eukprot:252241_1
MAAVADSETKQDNTESKEDTPEHKEDWSENKQEDFKKQREPFPDEIETEEEKNHQLKTYEDIAIKLSEIRELHLDGTLFEAHDKSEALIEYINTKYKSDTELLNKLLSLYSSHPRRKLIVSQLNETNRMLEFMTSSSGWQLYKDDTQWKTEWQTSDKSDYESFRITGIADVPLYNILAVIYEMDLIQTWMPLCKESVECGQLSLHCKCGLIRIGLFWPIQDRETVLFGYGVDDLKNGKILIYFDSTENNNSNCIKIPSCPDDRCRGDIHLGGFYFERITEKKTKITCVFNTDFKANLPVTVINWFAGTFSSQLLSYMVAAAKFDENSQYYQRIKTNKEFYGMVKRKLKEKNNIIIDNNDDTKQD